MKKKTLFVILFLLLSCEFNNIVIKETSCPKVYFAAEHRDYIFSNIQPITINNISYKARLDNYNFNSGCSLANDEFKSELSLLFVVNPENAKLDKVTLPYYVAILDDQNQLIAMEYYKVEGKLKINSSTKNYVETILRSKIFIKIPKNKEEIFSKNIVIIGFMLDNKKLDILN